MISSPVTGSFELQTRLLLSTQRDRPRTDLGPGQTPSASDDDPRGPGLSFERIERSMAMTSTCYKEWRLDGRGFMHQSDRQTDRVCVQCS